MVIDLSPLDRKVLRDLWRMRSQAFAIALVIAAGVGMVVMSVGMMRSLDATREAYYDRYRFADIFAPAKRAPKNVLDEIKNLPGVGPVEGRITAGATLDIAGIAEPITTRIHSIPMAREPRLNALVLRSGRWPDPARPDEVLASEKFAEAARIGPGDGVDALLYGKRQHLRVVGTVLSPEYIYAIGPGQIFPDNRRFGVLWMGEEHLAASLDLTDSFNEALVRIDRSADATDVIRRLDSLLARYGGAGAYRRSEQISDRYVTNELAELQTMTRILPPIFLGVAAFLINMVLSRLIDAEHEVIGLLMAFGYRGNAIMLHYAKIAVALSVPGLGLGILLGSLLGRGIASIYQEFFVFPFLTYRAGLDAYALACTVTLVVVLLGVFQSVRRVRRMTPVEAMRPPLPPDYAGGVARLIGKMRILDEPTRIILRGILRRPFRSGLGALGVAAALGLYITSAGSRDNVAKLIEILFDQSNRADVMVTFAEPRDQRALFELQRAPGVWRVEPIRTIGAKLTGNRRSKSEGLTTASAGSDLNRVVDIDGAIIDPPARGVLVSEGLSNELGVTRGDTIEVQVTEGNRARFSLLVADTIESAVGSPAYVDDAMIAAQLHQVPLLSGAYLGVDVARVDELCRYLKAVPIVAGVSLRAASRNGIEATIGETLGIVTLFNTGFSALIVFGVIYNNARISLAERSRDLASLRVLGYRRSEVSYILLGELAIISIIGLPVGVVLGYFISHYISSVLGGDLFTVPFGLTQATVAQAVLMVLLAAAITALFVRRRLDRLDLVAVLKSWD
ncbi:MAG: ABC transporter permease [Sphingomonadaceae bacterium]|nr:ABC transporter permease [Sphingomonadaceae bacterium]